MLEKITTPLDPNPINSPPSQPFTTKAGKFLGLVTFLLLIWILASKLITILNKEIVYVCSNGYQYNDFKTRANVTLDITDAIVGVNVLHLVGGVFDYVTIQQQFQHGINGTLQIVQMATKSWKKIPLIGCDHLTYCLPKNIPIQISYKNLRACSRKESQKCKPWSGSYFVQVHLLKKIINPFNPIYENITTHQQSIRTYRYQATQQPVLTYPVNEIEIYSDELILPTAGLFTDDRYDVVYQLDEEQQTWGKSDQFGINFEVTKKILKYQRRFRKIDAALAQVLAISTILGLLCRLLLSGYNTWAYQRYIIHKQLQKQPNISPPPKSTHLLNYIKHLLSSKEHKKQQEELFKQSIDQDKRIQRSVRKIVGEELRAVRHELGRLEKEIRMRVCFCGGKKYSKSNQDGFQKSQSKANQSIDYQMSQKDQRPEQLINNSFNKANDHGSFHQRLL